MNEKERILDLVRQNVITMEEAIELLEAAGKHEAASTFAHEQDMEGQPLIDNQDQELEHISSSQEAADFLESASGLSARLDQLQAQKIEVGQQLLVAQQRLREMEVFEELEELTEEMIQQKTDYQAQVADFEGQKVALNEKIATTQAELKGYRKDQINNYTEDLKRFVSQTKDTVTEKANHFSQEATKEGTKFSKVVTDLAKDFAKNFNTRDIDVKVANKSVKMPWVKENKFHHTFNFSTNDLTMVDISILNGSVDVQTYDGSQLIIESEITLYGAHDKEGLAAFNELATLSVDQGQAIIQVKSPRLAMDSKIKLPKISLQHLKLETFNGDQHIKGLTAKNLYSNSKNGDVSVSQSQIDFADVNLINGDTTLEANQIQDLTYHNVNGDFRVKGEVHNLIADTVNSNYYITKENLDNSRIKIKSITGTIKVSVPAKTNLEAEVIYHFGQLQHRLNDLAIENMGKEGAHLERHLPENQSQVLLNVDATHGTIYLKDNSI